MSVRGGVSLEIDGKKYALRLSVGAMAEIEDELDIVSINELSDLLQKGSASDFITILYALAKGGGVEISKEVIETLDYGVLAQLILDTLMDCMDSVEAEGGVSSPQKKTARRSSRRGKNGTASRSAKSG